jgi:predicted cobalt transporter CbtA
MAMSRKRSGVSIFVVVMTAATMLLPKELPALAAARDVGAL